MSTNTDNGWFASKARFTPFTGWAPLALAVLLGAAPSVQAVPLLGTAQGYGVLGASTVTNTGVSAVVGDLGVAPGTAITGLGGIVLLGTAHAGDASASLAQADAAVAYAWLDALAPGTLLSGQDLGGMTLAPGIYGFATSAQLTGTLTLDAQGDPNAFFVFQMGETLTTATGAMVNVVNGGSNVGVYWQVGTSATLGGGTQFAGNILADQSITLVTGASILCGRALALHAAVTMDTNRISNDCLGLGSLGSLRDDFGSGGFSGSPVALIPEPSTAAMGILGGLSLLGWAARARRRVDGGQPGASRSA
jgi:Ice-binding-like